MAPVLYYLRIGPPSRAVQLTADVLGLDIQLKAVDFFKGKKNLFIMKFVIYFENWTFSLLPFDRRASVTGVHENKPAPFDSRLHG